MSFDPINSIAKDDRPFSNQPVVDPGLARSELLGGERNLRSVMIAEDKLGERSVDLWTDYIAGKPVIDNLLALLSKPNIQENCAGLWGCAYLGVIFPSVKEALSQDSLGIVMQFAEDMGPLDDDESIYCFYMALELLVLC